MRDRLFVKDKSKLTIKLNKYFSRLPVPCPNCNELHMAFCEISYKSNYNMPDGKEFNCLKCSHELLLSRLLKTTEMFETTMNTESLVIDNLKALPDEELKEIYREHGVTNIDVVNMLKGCDE